VKYILFIFLASLLCFAQYDTGWRGGWNSGYVGSWSGEESAEVLYAQVAPYDTAIAGTANLSARNDSTREFINIGQNHRIRQDGDIEKVRLWIGVVDSLTDFRVRIWRDSSGVFNSIGTSENIATSLTSSSYNTVTLSSPITGIKEGDWIGWLARYGDVGNTNLLFAKTSSGDTIRYADTTLAATEPNAFNWRGQTAVTGKSVPIECYMTAPDAVFIGNSIMAGVPLMYGFCQTAQTTNLFYSIHHFFRLLTGMSVQNVAITSERTIDIKNRFVADVINKYPKVVVIEGGVNDITQDSSTAMSQKRVTYGSNMDYMFNACQNASNIQQVLALNVMPFAYGWGLKIQANDSLQVVLRESMMDTLKTIAAKYPKVTIVNPDCVITQIASRAGRAGHLCDPIPDLSNDGIHYKMSGYVLLAKLFVDSLDVAHRNGLAGTYTITLGGSGAGETGSGIYDGASMSADAYYGANPTANYKNYGFSLNLYGGAGSSTNYELYIVRRWIMQFIPSSATIVSSSDSIYCSSVTGAADTVIAWGVGQDWREGVSDGVYDSSGVCYNSRGRGRGLNGNWILGSDSAWTDSLTGVAWDTLIQPTAPAWWVLDVTRFDQAIVNGTIPNYGLRLNSRNWQQGKQWTIRSKRESTSGGAYRPRKKITFTVP
jgi:lysophospholipase L1-like esterase